MSKNIKLERILSKSCKLLNEMFLGGFPSNFSREKELLITTTLALEKNEFVKSIKEKIAQFDSPKNMWQELYNVCDKLSFEEFLRIVNFINDLISINLKNKKNYT